MDRSQSMDENLPVLIGARPKQSIARERNRQRMERSRSNSRGRSVLSRRMARGSAAELDMDDKSTPIRPRSGSVGFIDTTIGMGPATTLMSPRRYSNLGATGGEVLELVSAPPGPAGAAALPLLQPRERHHALRDSISTEPENDSASTSVIMDSEYVVLHDHADTVIQSSNHTDHPPPTNAAGANGIRRITSGPTYPSIVERMDIDLTVCKTNITSHGVAGNPASK